MRERRSRPGLLGPLLLITAGALLLLNQMGYLSWGVWETLLSFWPVILILIGIETLISLSRSPLLYLLGLLLLVVVVGGAVVYAVYTGGGAATSVAAAQSETLREMLQDAGQGRAELRLGAGWLHVGALSDSPAFVEGRIEYARYSRQVAREFRLSNGRAEFSVEARNRNFPLWFSSDDNGERWQFDFTGRIPLELRVACAAGEVQLDLSKLQVTDLNVSHALGQTTVTLPAGAGAGHSTAKISTALGEVVLEIPRGVGAKIKTSRLLGSVNLEGGSFAQSGDDYTTSNYGTAAYTVDVQISQLLGSIVIRQR
jgi:hypothetical protein